MLSTLKSNGTAPYIFVIFRRKKNVTARFATIYGVGLPKLGLLFNGKNELKEVIFFQSWSPLKRVGK